MKKKNYSNWFELNWIGLDWINWVEWKIRYAKKSSIISQHYTEHISLNQSKTNNLNWLIHYRLLFLLLWLLRYLIYVCLHSDLVMVCYWFFFLFSFILRSKICVKFERVEMKMEMNELLNNRFCWRDESIYKWLSCDTIEMEKPKRQAQEKQDISDSLHTKTNPIEIIMWECIGWLGSNKNRKTKY